MMGPESQREIEIPEIEQTPVDLVALRREEITAQGIIDMVVFHDDITKWIHDWVDSGLAKLFRELVEGTPRDEELVDLVHTQPAVDSPEVKAWARKVYDHVLQEQKEQSKNG